MPGKELLPVKHIAQAQQWDGVLNNAERCLGRSAYTLGGRFRHYEVRTLGLKLLQLAHPSVVLGVADVWVVQHVVAVVGGVDLFSKLLDPL